MRWWLMLYAVTACSRVTTTPGDNPDARAQLVVNIDRRPTVRDATAVLITLESGNGTAFDSVPVTGGFPIVYEVATEGQSGRLDIKVDAVDSTTGILVGRGATTTSYDSLGALVMLQGADFVVNSSFTGNQFLTNDFEAGGLQLAATDFGIWTAVFRYDCISCAILGRRFDELGVAVQTGANAGEFGLSTIATTPAAIPAVAAGQLNTLAFWDFTDPNSSAQGVACRALTSSGEAAVPGQPTIAAEPADVVTANRLVSGDFVVTWQTTAPMPAIRAAIVHWDCSVVAGPFTVSVAQGTSGPHRSHAASTGYTVLYSWIVDGDLHIRAGTDQGEFMSSEAVLAYHGAADTIEHARVAPWGANFAVAVRRAATNGLAAGSIELYTVAADGHPSGPPLLISGNSGSDFASVKAFGIAQNSEHILLVTWHQCPSGPGSCDVMGRFVYFNGGLVGDPFVVSTTTTGDQISPSITAVDKSFAVAWTDSSGTFPDQSGDAVRARIIYP